MKHETVTRLEVIDEHGRAYTRRDVHIELSFQDGDRTLKVFVEPRPGSQPRRVKPATQVVAPVPNRRLETETMVQFHERIITQYPANKIDAAVAYLQEQVLNATTIADIRKAIAQAPEDWIAPFHFFFGMDVRNALRAGGFSENYWPIWNLDDIYVPLVERAVKER